MKEIQYAGTILGLANQIKRVFNITTDYSGVQVRILYFILTTYPERDIYQKDIEAALNIKSASVSTLLKKMEAQKIIKREKVSYDDRLKKILPTVNTVNMKAEIDSYIASLEAGLTAGIEKSELDNFFHVLQKMQENMKITEQGGKHG